MLTPTRRDVSRQNVFATILILRLVSQPVLVHLDDEELDVVVARFRLLNQVIRLAKHVRARAHEVDRPGIQDDLAVRTVPSIPLGHTEHDVRYVEMTYRFLEQVGTYDPKQDPAEIKVQLDRVDHWISEGAQPTDTVASLLRRVRRESAAAEQTAG